MTGPRDNLAPWEKTAPSYIGMIRSFRIYRSPTFTSISSKNTHGVIRFASIVRTKDQTGSSSAGLEALATFSSRNGTLVPPEALRASSCFTRKDLPEPGGALMRKQSGLRTDGRAT